LSPSKGGDAVSEAYIQSLVHEHPACLPIAEIDAMFTGPVPICTELNTPAGPIDYFMVTPSGLPVLNGRRWRLPGMQTRDLRAQNAQDSNRGVDAAGNLVNVG
jgi:hypothetical protein